ncbi:hypothetical protein TNCT_369091 [Trichonephila clavata]|uniref:Uncharacterized protein n=1 Tax=Trichonephila clavata TaxID=2740835 RepID=A0A8X6LSK4_TRICU|nr:hypothetical protein TNCT_369091 [Trichonephila clavata]
MGSRQMGHFSGTPNTGSGKGTKVAEPYDPASPIVPNPASPHKTRPRSPFGTDRVSYILSKCPECRRRDPFQPSCGAQGPWIWKVRRQRERGESAIFQIPTKDRERCTRHPGRGNGVESPAPSTPLEWVQHSDDSGVFLKRQQSPRNRGMNT